MLRYLEGQSAEEIASYFGLHPATIHGILNSPLVRQEMEKLSQGAVGRVQNLTDEALDLVKDTMRGAVGSELRFKAATRILDYNPELNPRKSEARDLVEGLGEGMIRAIGKQLREMEKGKDEPIEVEVGSGQV
jgi:DNA-directed RNA polymerase specialized sigma24 family protein